MVAECRIGKGRGIQAVRNGRRFYENYISAKQMISELENDGWTNTLKLRYFIDKKYVERVKDKLPPYSLRGLFYNVIVID